MGVDEELDEALTYCAETFRTAWIMFSGYCIRIVTASHIVQRIYTLFDDFVRFYPRDDFLRIESLEHVHVWGITSRDAAPTEWTERCTYRFLDFGMATITPSLATQLVTVARACPELQCISLNACSGVSARLCATLASIEHVRAVSVVGADCAYDEHNEHAAADFLRAVATIGGEMAARKCVAHAHFELSELHDTARLEHTRRVLAYIKQCDDDVDELLDSVSE